MSYGGGKQTVELITLILEDKLPKPDLTVMADTSRHPSPLKDGTGGDAFAISIFFQQFYPSARFVIGTNYSDPLGGKVGEIGQDQAAD